MQKYLNLLSISRIIRQKHHYIEQVTGYNFNIFSILDRERNEVTTHSYFLYELFNPKGSHGQGIKLLKLFLDEILMIHEYGDLASVNVERESLTSYSRRIDFVIECESVIIGIEMKIDAGDQQKQLFDYYEELHLRAEGKKKIKLYYLTLDGKDPSKSSIGELDVNKIENISFDKEISDWVKRCMEVSVEIPILREALKQYLILIEKLTGKKESMVEELSELLLQGDNLSDAIELEKSIEKAKVKVQKRFWQSMQEKLGDQFQFVNFDFSSVSFDTKVNKYYELSNGYRYYGLKKDLFEIEGYVISYYLELHNKPYHGLTVAKKETDGIFKRGEYANQDIFRLYKENLKKSELFSKESAWWLGWKYFDCSNEADFYKFNEVTQQFTDNEKLESYVGYLVSEMKVTMNQLKKMFPAANI